MNNRPFQSIKVTCEQTGLSEHFIRKRIAEGSCPCIRSGNKYLINVPAFLQLLNDESNATIQTEENE